MRRQHQEMDRPGGRQVKEGSGDQGITEETGCEIICGAPMTLAVKGKMMMMMMIMMICRANFITNFDFFFRQILIKTGLEPMIFDH